MYPWNKTRIATRFQHNALWIALRSLVSITGCFLILFESAFGQAPSTTAGDAAREHQNGIRFFEKRQYAAAVARFAKAAAQEPGNSLYLQWLGRAYGLEAENANLFAKPGLAGLARDALQKAVALDPNNLGARSDLAAFYHAAPSFMGGGRDKARAQVEEIRKRDPYFGKVREGDLLQDENRLAESERVYLSAVALDTRRPISHERLGSLYVETGRYAQAFAQWDTMLQTDPMQMDALHGMGKTAASSGQRQAEGEASLRKFLQVYKFDPDGPTLAHGHYYLGVLAAKRNDRDAARKEFEEALRLNPRLKEASQARSNLGK